MSKFSNMIGNLSFKIGNEEITIVPKLGDNDKFMKIQSIENETERLERIKEFITDLMIRSYPEENQDEIKLGVELNINDFIKEILIAFKWTTRDKIESVEKLQEEKVKNLM